MKMITAIIQPEKLSDVKDALFNAKVTKMTVSTVRGCGQQAGYSETYRGAIVEVNLLNKVKVEVAVNEEYVKPTLDAIIRAARTGKIGDGKIFITNLEECIRIRTGETGQTAIG